MIFSREFLPPAVAWSAHQEEGTQRCHQSLSSRGRENGESCFLLLSFLMGGALPQQAEFVPESPETALRLVIQVQVFPNLRFQKTLPLAPLPRLGSRSQAASTGTGQLHFFSSKLDFLPSLSSLIPRCGHTWRLLLRKELEPHRDH